MRCEDAAVVGIIKTLGIGLDSVECFDEEDDEK